jgi:hypothetical protein
MAPTLRERYCAHWQISPDAYEEHLFRRSLYFHARGLRGLFQLVDPDYFAADREFIRVIGDLRSRRGFHAEAGEFHATGANRAFLRRWLRFRVSVERTRLWMEECWRSLESDDSAPPTGAVSGR